jgi:hypothetical protein
MVPGFYLNGDRASGRSQGDRSRAGKVGPEKNVSICQDLSCPGIFLGFRDGSRISHMLVYPNTPKETTHSSQNSAN